MSSTHASQLGLCSQCSGFNSVVVSWRIWPCSLSDCLDSRLSEQTQPTGLLSAALSMGGQKSSIDIKKTPS